MHLLLGWHALGLFKCLRTTLQVVPFTPAAGLLEWVEETEPLLPYLIGDHPFRGGAWGRYHRSHDKDFVQSRSALETVQKTTTSSDKMAKAFNQVCRLLAFENHASGKPMYSIVYSCPAEAFAMPALYVCSVLQILHSQSCIAANVLLLPDCFLSVNHHGARGSCCWCH